MSAAVFVIARDENYFLPKWISYYKQYFKPEDIYVVDNDTNDGSTDNLDVNVIKVSRSKAADHQWILDTVQEIQADLLKRYKVVLNGDCDEFLYCLNKPLDQFLLDFMRSDLEYATAIGYEMVQNLDTEKPLAEDAPIMPNRGYWARHPQYDKTLCSKVPIRWIWGFHSHNKQNIYHDGLHLLHLHRHDFELMHKRHLKRVETWDLKNNGSHGYQNKISGRDELMQYFKKLENVKPIPAEHKAAITGL